METSIPPEQEQVRRLFESFSLSEQDIEAFIYQCVDSNDGERARQNDYLMRLVAAGKNTLAGRSSIPDPDMRSLIVELNEALNLGINNERYDPALVAALRQLRSVGSLLLFVSVSYLVIGGVWSGESGLNDEFGRWIIYAALATLILVLAMLEGTQLSVTALKMKDVEPVKEEFPNTHRLHRIFKTDTGIKKYLAGRQMMVIVIVFCIAQLLSFPTIANWPLTTLPLPAFFDPWIHLVFFKLGILGALFVLWMGQLVPQFLAASNPQGFLNWPGMGLILKAAYWSESLGITQPATWLTRYAHTADRIPPSNKEIFFETSQNAGYAVLSLTKEVIITANKAVASTSITIQVLAPDHDSIIDDSITFLQRNLVAGSDVTICSLVRNDKLAATETISVTSEDLIDSKSGMCSRQIEIGSQEGGFQKSDIISIHNSMELSTCETAAITIKSPTHYTRFYIEIHDDPAELEVPSVLLHNWDAIRNGFCEHGEKVEPLISREAGGAIRYEHTSLYPRQFTKHRYRWSINYLES